MSWALPMASPRRSQGVGPPDPMDVAALQPKVMLGGEREGAVATAVCPVACVAAGPACKALLVLALCLSATALPYSLGVLSALPPAPPGSLPPPHAWLGSAASQQGAGDNLVATHGDLLHEPGMQLRVRELLGSADVPGCFSGVEGDVSHGKDAEGWSLGTPTVATQLVSASEMAPVPSDAPARAGPSSQSHSTADQPGDEQLLALGTSSGHGMPASDLSTAGGFSDIQHVASVTRATMRGCNGQKEEVRPSPVLPDLSVHEDHTAAPQLVPLPAVPSALPSERTSISTETPPGTIWAPSAGTPEMLWDTQPAGTSLHGKAALLVDTVLDKAPGNGSELLAAVLASLPSAASAPSVHHPQVLVPSLPTAEPGGPAATSEKLSDWSSLQGHQTMLTSTEVPAPSAWTRAPSAPGPQAGVNSAAPGAIPEPGATKDPCEDGAPMVASPFPRVSGVTHSSPLGSPTQRPPLHPDPTSGHCQAVMVTEMTVAEEAGNSKPRAASVGPATAQAGPPGPATAPAGPPGPTHANPGSAPPPSSENPALEHGSEAVHHTSTTGLPSPAQVLPSPGATRAASPLLSSQTLPGMTLNAQAMSGHPGTSWHPSTASKHLPAGEGFTPAGLVTMVKPPELSPPVHVLPLQFRLLGIAYTQALGSRSSGSYRELEEEVRLMLSQMLSTYETFLQANVLEFLNSSVVVRGEALFRGDAPAPTNSHLIRTVVTEASRGRSIFSWGLDPQSVQSSGFSVENLDPEKLSISLTVFQLGRNRTGTLERLTSGVTQSLSALYHVRNFTITQLRNTSGVLEITGDIYLDTIVHADVAEVLQALTALVTCSVDLTSLWVEGARLHLQVYPVSFLVTNRHFSQDLLDPFAIEQQELTRDLGDAVARALRDHRSFLQVVIRGFLPGSLICHGDVVFQHPAPTSLEVLEALVLSVGPEKALAGSDFQVDPYSLAVGEDTLEPPQPEPGFPEYGVTIMVVCGLCLIIVPVVLLLCLRTKRLQRWDVAVLWDTGDPEVGTQTLEMDNWGFWESSEQDPEDAPAPRQSHPA